MKDTFENIVREYEKPIYNLSLRMTGNEDDAFDCTQDIFLRVYKTMDSFRGESAFSTWLYRVAVNICKDFLRKRGQRYKNEIPLFTEAPENSEEFVPLDIPDMRYAPETHAEKMALREALQGAIDRLSPEHREILLMREILGLTYQQIAESLSIEEGTVKSRIARAREQMRTRLVKDGNFYHDVSSKKMKGR